MPIYEFACPSGHRFSELIRVTPTPGDAEVRGVTSRPCPKCAGEGRRVVSSFAALGLQRARTAAGPPRRSWPRSWEATNRGDPETIGRWTRAIETRMRHEERDPSLGSQPAAPVHFHEHSSAAINHPHAHAPDGHHAGKGDGISK